MKIDIQPRVALCDERIGIKIGKLKPFEKIKISASMHLPWAPKIEFESHAFLLANQEGIVDLSKQKPETGSYNYADSMGLINSLKIPKGAKIEEIGNNISIEKSLFVKLTVQGEDESATIDLERIFISKEIKTIKISDPFVGDFFYSDKKIQNTIVLLGGSDGNSKALLPIASLLASHGFNVLAVAYFNQQGLPPKLERVPLEYFDHVFSWLQSNPETKNNGIFLWGGSKGGELALLLASRYPVIRKVIAANPHAYCFQGVNFKKASSWTVDEKDLPYIRLRNRVLLSNIISCFIHQKPFGFTHTYRKGIEEAVNKEAARIKIEKSNADILLFAGKKDNIWNSSDGCTLVMEKLKENNYARSYQYIEYEDAGHAVYAPYIIPLDGISEIKIFPRLTYSAGGNLSANALAQADMWQKTLAFFRN
jgi:dienelactone hydrolase